MTALFRNILLGISITILFFAFSHSALAAAPDGLGPWADSVFNASQGLEKNGNPVPAVRSDPTSALGVAENDTVDGHFYSLGFGGSIALGFDNGISSGVIIVEATNPGYPNETAKVEVSENGTTWVTAGNVTADGQVSKPDGITCAKYVRITDTSDKANFSDDTADGYDVDGVQASGEPCTPPTPTPTVTPTPTPTPTCPQAGCGCSSITQNNSTVVLTKVVSKSNTGGNKASGNTGGSNSITTGNSTSNSSVTVTGGSNVLNATPCCNNSGDTNVTISGNGAGSTNNVNINSGKSKDPKKDIKLLFKKK